MKKEKDTLQERVDFLEKTVNKLWDEHYGVQQQIWNLGDKKVKKPLTKRQSLFVRSVVILVNFALGLLLVVGIGLSQSLFLVSRYPLLLVINIGLFGFITFEVILILMVDYIFLTKFTLARKGATMND